MKKNSSTNHLVDIITVANICHFSLSTRLFICFRRMICYLNSVFVHVTLSQCCYTIQLIAVERTNMISFLWNALWHNFVFIFILAKGKQKYEFLKNVQKFLSRDKTLTNENKSFLENLVQTFSNVFVNRTNCVK